MEINKAIKYFLRLTSIIVFLTSCSSENNSLKVLNSQSVILAFGDSLTYGKGANLSNSYPAQLQKMLGIKVVNKGISGEVSANGLKRLPSILQEVQPDLVIVCHGGNDILRKLSRQKLKNNLKEMVNLIKASGAQVVLLGVPKPGLFLNSLDLYRTLAKELKLPIDDEVIASVLAKNTFKADHVHPNQKGYKKIAEAVAQILKDNGAIIK